MSAPDDVVQAKPCLVVDERASRSKGAALRNEDVVVETPVLVAVVDGATSEHDEHVWSFDGEPCSSGEWAARTVARALHDVGMQWTARRAVDHLTQVLAQECRSAHGDVPAEQLPAASFAAVHGPRRELWAVGDCQWLVDGHLTRPGKRVDVVAAELRAAVHAALAAGAVFGEEVDDPGRAVILPFLRLQQSLAGTSGEFGYGNLDGRTVLEEHLRVVALPPGAQVVLATDGYPELHADLARTESALHRALRDDPLCIGRLRGTKGLDMNRLPASQRYKRKGTRWKRYEKARPGHRVQIDVKFLEPSPGAAKRRYYQYTAIDDCTRLRVLRVYPKHDQKTAIQFLDYVLEKLPFQVDTIQTDNGAEFQAAFHWHVLDRGIKHTYIRPATPRLNGKVERSHRIDAEEFYRLLDGVVIDDTALFTNKLQEWEDFYNFHRPHGGLGGQTPYERLVQKAKARP